MPLLFVYWLLGELLSGFLGGVAFCSVDEVILFVFDDLMHACTNIEGGCVVVWSVLVLPIPFAFLLVDRFYMWCLYLLVGLFSHIAIEYYVVAMARFLDSIHVPLGHRAISF
jgi:predicted membrane chloride channel (bestrophin family)